jgi:hypothetical protein
MNVSDYQLEAVVQALIDLLSPEALARLKERLETPWPPNGELGGTI